MSSIERGKGGAGAAGGDGDMQVGKRPLPAGPGQPGGVGLPPSSTAGKSAAIEKGQGKPASSQSRDERVKYVAQIAGKFGGAVGSKSTVRRPPVQAQKLGSGPGKGVQTGAQKKPLPTPPREEEATAAPKKPLPLNPREEAEIVYQKSMEEATKYAESMPYADADDAAAEFEDLLSKAGKDVDKEPRIKIKEDASDVKLKEVIEETFKKPPPEKK